RRQKCDEERAATSGACRTCRRLNIECLGWGAKRPDWMRDKEKVAAYRASLKDQFTRAGLVRGHPRSMYMRALPGNAASNPAAAVRVTRTSPTPTILNLPPHHKQAMDPHNSFKPQVHAQAYGAYSPASVSPMIPITPTPADERTQYEQPSFPAPAPVMTHEDLMIYYFEHVRKVQYVFAGNSLTNLLYSIVVTEPTGAVADTVGALASLHLSRSRVAQDLEPAAAAGEMPLTKQYYENARIQLVQDKQMHGQYTETDAVAAVQLVSFSLLSGAWRDWGDAEFEVACDWLAQTRIHEEQDPKTTLLSMTPVARFAVEATMWIDVLSSIAYMQPPRFLSLYRRLFEGSAGGLWANAQQDELRIDLLTGYPYEALLALAEVSALAHWKTTEQRAGGLSVRELMHRGDQIKKTLLAQCAAPRAHGDGSRTPLDPRLSVRMGSGFPDVPDAVSMEEARRLAREIFCETALLYLHTVLHGSYPDVPEVSGSVTNLVRLFSLLNPSKYDRALIFPLFLMGCMTDDEAVCNAVRQRLLRLDDKLGNILQVVQQLDEIWSHRIVSAQHGINEPVHWRESLSTHTVLL
ncbi:hypothetical protein WOLCODRAFT_64841, partial [Wolfiporia cocos MD-104 SS10]